MSLRYIIISIFHSLEQTGRSDRPWTFVIFNRTSPFPLEVAVDSESEMREWMSILSNANLTVVESVSLC